MQFAQAVDYDLVRLPVGAPFEGWVFLGNFRQRSADLLLIAARFGAMARPYIGVG
jgi:hypothetical protein